MQTGGDSNDMMADTGFGLWQSISESDNARRHLNAD